MRLSILVPAVSILVAASLSAQTKVISPAQAARASGNYNYNYWPFRTNSNVTYRYGRIQQVMDMPANAKGKLSAIAMRGSPYLATRGALPAFSATMEVKVSTSPTTGSTMLKSFAANEGKDSTMVVTKKVVKFAKYPLLPKFPQPFFYKIPFDKNKVLSFAGKKSLCVDMTAYDNSLYNATTKVYSYAYMDAVNFRAGNGIISHSGRPGFSSTTLTFLPFYGYTYANIRTGGTVGKGNLQIYAYAYNAVPNSAGFHVLSAGKMPVGIPIAGGSSLYVNLGAVVAVTPSVATTYGSFQFPARVTGKPMTYMVDTPFQTAWRGIRLYGQGFVFDAKANKAGLVSTQLNEVELPSYYQPTGYPVSYMYEYQSGTRKYNYLALGQGHVMELTFN